MQCYKSALKDAIRFFRQWRMAIQEAKALEMVRRISALMAHFTCLRKDTLMESFPLSQYSISSRNRVRSWRKHGSVLLVFCAPKDRLNRAYFEVMLMHTVPGHGVGKGITTSSIWSMRYILHERMAMNALAFIKDMGNEGVPPGTGSLA